MALTTRWCTTHSHQDTHRSILPHFVVHTLHICLWCFWLPILFINSLIFPPDSSYIHLCVCSRNRTCLLVQSPDPLLPGFDSSPGMDINDGAVWVSRPQTRILLREKFQIRTCVCPVLFHLDVYVFAYLEFGAIHPQQEFSVHIFVPELRDVLLHV